MFSTQALPSVDLAVNKVYLKFSVSQASFSSFFAAALLFSPQNTTPPEIPQAVAAVNPTIQANHTPVRGAFSSLGMKIWVRINVLSAFIF